MLAAGGTACDSDCAMAGDARTATLTAVRITFRFVLIVDLTRGFLVAPAVVISAFSTGDKTAAAHEFVQSNIIVMAI
jgi:hypothetical protein